MVHIVLEGDDGVGKTTTAMHLKDMLGLNYIHHTEPNKYDKPIEQVFDDAYAESPMIIDRFALSDAVYSIINRSGKLLPWHWKYNDIVYFVFINANGTSAINNKYKTILNQFPLENTPRYVFINSEYVRSHAHPVWDDIGWFVKNGFKFQTAMDTPVFTVVPQRVNSCSFYSACPYFSFHSTNSVFKYITTGIGVSNAKVLFVGEAPGINGCGRFGSAFYGDRSGMMFRQALFDLHLGEGNAYITNVIKCTPQGNYTGGKYFDADMEILDKELRDNNTKNIIAVGRVADNALTELGYNHKFIYHPAFFLRQGQNATDFTKELRTII